MHTYIWNIYKWFKIDPLFAKAGMSQYLEPRPYCFIIVFSFVIFFYLVKLNVSVKLKEIKYSRLSLSRIPRDSLKYFEISIPRHIRFAELKKK